MILSQRKSPLHFLKTAPHKSHWYPTLFRDREHIPGIWKLQPFKVMKQLWKQFCQHFYVSEKYTMRSLRACTKGIGASWETRMRKWRTWCLKNAWRIHEEMIRNSSISRQGDRVSFWLSLACLEDRIDGKHASICLSTNFRRSGAVVQLRKDDKLLWNPFKSHVKRKLKLYRWHWQQCAGVERFFVPQLASPKIPMVVGLRWIILQWFSRTNFSGQKISVCSVLDPYHRRLLNRDLEQHDCQDHSEN